MERRSVKTKFTIKINDENLLNDDEIIAAGKNASLAAITENNMESARHQRRIVTSWYQHHLMISAYNIYHNLNQDDEYDIDDMKDIVRAFFEDKNDFFYESLNDATIGLLLQAGVKIRANAKKFNQCPESTITDITEQIITHYGSNLDLETIMAKYETLKDEASTLGFVLYADNINIAKEKMARRRGVTRTKIRSLEEKLGIPYSKPKGVTFNYIP